MPLRYTCLPFAELSVTQLYEILRLRAEVFIMEQHCLYQDLDRHDFGCLHYGGYDAEGRLLAYSRLAAKGVIYPDHCSVGRVITSPLLRGQGEGRRLMAQSIGLAFRHFAEGDMKIMAQAYLQRFYESFGFVVGSAPFLEDGLPHINMYLSRDQWLAQAPAQQP